MKKTKMVSLLVTAVLLCALPGCSSADPLDEFHTGDAELNMQNDPAEEENKPKFDGKVGLAFQKEQSMHPYQTDSNLNKTVGKLIYEGLFSEAGAFSPQ